MLDQISSVAELIGALGVILSLVYVGKQLKQTNLMTRSSVHLTRSNVLVDWATTIACAPELCETLAKVHYHKLVREDATDVERMQLGYLFAALLAQIHMSFEQHKEGILSQEEVEEFFGPAAAVIAQPYLASAWPILKGGYPIDFQEWFQSRYNLPN